MERDRRFEIQYLISVVAVVLSSLTINNISESFDNRVAYILLLMIAIHVCIFNISYMYRDVSGFEISAVEKITEVSRATLLTITATFLFLLFHIITRLTVHLYYFIHFRWMNDNLMGFDCQSVITLIPYLVPFLGTIAMAVPFGKKIKSAFSDLSDIEVAVVPKDIHVFSEYEETEPLFIKISNNGDNEEEFTVRFQLPDDVRWKKPVGSLNSTNFEESESVAPDRRYTVNLSLACSVEEPRTDILTIEFIHSAGKMTQDVKLWLDPS